MEERNESIRNKFNKLLMGTVRSIDQNVDIKLIRTFFIINGINKEKLRSACDIHDVYGEVKEHITFCNTDLLEKLIEEFGSDEDKQKLKDYKEEFNKYVFVMHNNRVKTGETIKKWEKVSIKLYREDEDPPTGRELTIMKRKIAKYLDVRTTSLHLCKIRGGCLELEFLVPDVRNIYTKLQQLKSEEKAKMLQEDDIIYIQCHTTSQRV